MSSEQNYGQVAYEAYRAHTGGKSLVSGQPIPDWQDLPRLIQSAWEAAAEAILRPLVVRLDELEREHRAWEAVKWRDIQLIPPIQESFTGEWAARLEGSQPCYDPDPVTAVLRAAGEET